MDIHRLEVFCKVLELQSFTKAADAVCLTQPTVSEHIRALEESIGEKLVDRLGREVLPTPAGKILYRYARDIILLRDEAIQALEKYKGKLSGHLLIGASTIPGTYILPQLIGSFKDVHPTIQITLKISSSAEVVQRILDGKLEMGLIGARWDDRKIVLEEIFSDELVLAVYPEHPFARKEAVELEEIAKEPFILRERGSGTRMVMNRALEENGFAPSRLSVVAEMGSTEAVRQGIKARIGISILSAKAVSEDLERNSLVAVPLKGVRLPRSFYLIQRRNRQPSPLCTAFLNHVRAHSS
ncbi:selenium metabolism-associated LysR family transcriptional regulator [Desulforhabdus amnigena]|jgi:DNA-binding transcriptional LysR family regulator|uniref:LysR family transcriptional regulator n=1 Tax=Desulforhabdus amnigena TaxID=40218 RepID=A0A9W6FWZ0_9BACT|nr:selenium metabolism-associated LysR family transcriptional regulator [Desulforhabdus amnigena]NLJ27111.1 LysR family transcriptional regulator [Deltaproteobacteria bacterium]GLI36416.1 LysR family transcriptional regulator [Desulforhabdus amnigena]